MTLYEIDSMILSIVNQDTGEIEGTEMLDSLLMERGNKIENVACWIKSLESEAEAIRAEEKALAERRYVRERKVARLTEWLKSALQGDTFISPRCEVTYRKSTRVEVDDLAVVLDWACENQPLVVRKKLELDKKELGVLLKKGVDVPGARVETVRNMKIK